MSHASGQPGRRYARRTVRSVLTSALVALGVLMLSIAPAAPAHADPTVAEIEAQIAKVWNDAEPLIEQYNEVHERYQKNKARQAQLVKQILPLERELDLARVRIGAISAQVYKGGQIDAVNLLLSAGSPSELAEQLAYIDQLTREQQRQVQDVALMKSEYDTAKAPIDQLVAELAEQDRALAAQRKEIEARLAQLQALRIKAYGTTNSTGSYRPWPCPSEYLPTSGYKAASFACSQAGKPYVWAASGPNSYDCSGLTLASWRQVGVYLPHNAAAQRRSIPYVSRANLRIGDLVFYYSNLHHVAIYVGDNKVMSAPTFGDHVRMIRMDYGPIHSFGRPG